MVVKKEKLYCFQGNESTIPKRTSFNLQYSWATYLLCGVEHTVLCIFFIYIKDTVWDHNMHYWQQHLTEDWTTLQDTHMYFLGSLSPGKIWKKDKVRTEKNQGP